MASSVTIKASNVCGAGTGGHAHITLSGDASAQFEAHFEEVGNAAQALSNEEMLAAIIKVALLTRTPAQVKSALLSVPGLTVTV